MTASAWCHGNNDFLQVDQKTMFNYSGAHINWDKANFSTKRDISIGYPDFHWVNLIISSKFQIPNSHRDWTFVPFYSIEVANFNKCWISMWILGYGLDFENIKFTPWRYSFSKGIGGHWIGIKIYGCQPNLEMAI